MNWENRGRGYRAPRESGSDRGRAPKRAVPITPLTPKMDTKDGNERRAKVREERKKDRRPVTFPVVNIETPPLEINLQRKASSLLRNVNRASVAIGDCGSSENGRDYSLAQSSVLVRDSWGTCVPQDPSPTRWKFIYARDDFRMCLRQRVCHEGTVFHVNRQINQSIDLQSVAQTERVAGKYRRVDDAHGL